MNEPIQNQQQDSNGMPPMETVPVVPPTPVIPPMPANDVEVNKDMAALSYVWILSLIVFYTKRQSPFVSFHAKQGIVLFILSIAFWFIPVVGKLLELAVLALCAMGFVAAAQGHWKDQLFVGAIAKGDWKQLRTSWKEFVKGIVDAWHHFRPAKKAEPAPAPAPSQPSPAPTIPPVAPPEPPPYTPPSPPTI